MPLRPTHRGSFTGEQDERPRRARERIQPPGLENCASPLGATADEGEVEPERPVRATAVDRGTKAPGRTLDVTACKPHRALPTTGLRRPGDPRDGAIRLGAGASPPRPIGRGLAR